MAWRYCRVCDTPMEFPTWIDAVVGTQRCPQCDFAEDLDERERRAVLQDKEEEDQCQLMKISTTISK